MDINITIENSGLSKEQKFICLNIYNSLKTELLNIINNINDDNINDTEILNNIVNIICVIVKYVEKIKINNKPLTGEEKKNIALEFGKIFIINEIQNNNLKQTILIIYDISAESILENIINVSKNINISPTKCNKWFSCLQ
jgi:hypothetical protein